MSGGFFITLYDKESLELYLRNGLYGFLMNPVQSEKPSNRSKHYAALADYACSREGAHVFFFLNREIIYGGKIKGNRDIASFYLNGKTSPLGRKASAELFWDESIRYTATEIEGEFKRQGALKAQPFIIQFETNSDTRKLISSDDLYFELGQFPYPLPSNTIQGMSFCTLTPGETAVALELIKKSKKTFKNEYEIGLTQGKNQTLFYSALLSYDSFQNEAHIEFTLLSDLAPIQELITSGSHVLCRQVPISPFKPFQMDRSDICLYDLDKPIRGGTVPNTIIELKKDRANYKAYEQVVRYLNWLEKVLGNPEEFGKISAFIVAPGFYIKRSKIELKFENKIKMFNLDTKEFYDLEG